MLSQGPDTLCVAGEPIGRLLQEGAIVLLERGGHAGQPIGQPAVRLDRRLGQRIARRDLGERAARVFHLLRAALERLPGVGGRHVAAEPGGGEQLRGPRPRRHRLALLVDLLAGRLRAAGSQWEEEGEEREDAAGRSRGDEHGHTSH